MNVSAHTGRKADEQRHRKRRLRFGAVLLPFFVARFHYAMASAAASRHLSLTLGALNTAVLITSSFFMALRIFPSCRRRRGDMARHPVRPHLHRSVKA